MKILHVVASIQKASGGPAVSVTRLAAEQARLGHEAMLATLDYRCFGAQVEAPGVRVVSVEADVLAVRGRGWSPKFARRVRELAGEADVVHNHGLWMWPNAYARRAAQSAGRPLVISPRGMLESWALGRSRIKKAVAWRLFEKANLQAAGLFHATSAAEARSIREAVAPLRRANKRGEGNGEPSGSGIPVVVAPNGVDLPDLSKTPSRAVMEMRFPQLAGRRWVVFLSRLHIKKGIDLLLRAWGAQKKVAGGGWRVAGGEQSERTVLILAGPDLTGYRAEVERMVKELGVADSVVLTGEVQGEGKDSLLANADIVVLPSRSENFGLVVAEALSWGRPVITTTGTPWEVLPECGAGWWVEPKEGALTEALREALRMGDAERSKMGRKGRELVTAKYGWGAAAQQVLDAYGAVVLTKMQNRDSVEG